ncbi:hypothetical protein [Candidatus Fokinia crypta]|uniref:1-deoxy-D-xylulose 5-phosphate reductoisomerase n=1 Tax=Candidatus Fokinia crypta TaxID=1920990 RepID=A0ABZ0UNM7_9RICK|nr:hypothetical protein [Candidatus Fokinia cryptica]WPX97735.1 1-deoxy-D-xylulose 5-phosphate reductoisomerase [Candidatus Fokinia cryptica]
MKKVIILGVTGSVGLATLQAFKKLGCTHAIKSIMTRGSDIKKLEKIVREFDITNIIITNRSAISQIRSTDFKRKVRILSETEEICNFLQYEQHDTCVSAISGIAGLIPTILTMHSCKRLIIANKEAIICGNKLFIEHAIKLGVEIIPIDSEHHAIHSILTLNNDTNTCNINNVRKLILTATGSSIWKNKILPQDATKMDILTHPVWKMGNVITVNSASMMNKVFEMYEASILFGIPMQNVDALLHPVAVVHGIVQYKNGTSIMHCRTPTMVSPIMDAILYPQQHDANKTSDSQSASENNFFKNKTFEFYDIDTELFPLFRLAKTSMTHSSIVALNAINEFYVQQFLNDRISFQEMIKSIEGKFEKYKNDTDIKSFQDIIEYHNDIQKML